MADGLPIPTSTATSTAAEASPSTGTARTTSPWARRGRSCQLAALVAFGRLCSRRAVARRSLGGRSSARGIGRSGACSRRRNRSGVGSEPDDPRMTVRRPRAPAPGVRCRGSSTVNVARSAARSWRTRAASSPRQAVRVVGEGLRRSAARPARRPGPARSGRRRRAATTWSRNPAAAAPRGSYTVAWLIGRGEGGGREAVAAELDGEARHGHADGDLVQADLERSLGADAHVGREQQDRAHGQRVAGVRRSRPASGTRRSRGRARRRPAAGRGRPRRSRSWWPGRTRRRSVRGDRRGRRRRPRRGPGRGRRGGRRRPRGRWRWPCRRRW